MCWPYILPRNRANYLLPRNRPTTPEAFTNSRIQRGRASRFLGCSLPAIGRLSPPEEIRSQGLTARHALMRPVSAGAPILRMREALPAAAARRHSAAPGRPPSPIRRCLRRARPSTRSCLQLSVDELIGLLRSEERRQPQMRYVRQHRGHLGLALDPRLAVDDLKDAGDDRLHRQARRGHGLRVVDEAFLQEEHERDVAVLDSLHRAGSDGVSLHEPDVRDERVYLEQLGERPTGFPAAMRPVRAGEERLGDHVHEHLKADFVHRHERILLVGEQPVEHMPVHPRKFRDVGNRRGGVPLTLGQQRGRVENSPTVVFGDLLLGDPRAPGRQRARHILDRHVGHERRGRSGGGRHEHAPVVLADRPLVGLDPRQQLVGVAGELAAPDLEHQVLIGGIYRILATRLRRGEAAISKLTDELLAWIKTYERPVCEHHWRMLVPGPPAPPSPFVPDVPIQDMPGALPPGRPRISEEQIAENHRRRILYATTLLGERKGYTATTVADITKLARVDGHVFYRLFADKQDAFMSVHEIGFQVLMDVISKAFFAGTDWPHRSWEAGRALTQLLEVNPLVAHVGFVEAHAVGPGAVQ